MKKKLIIGMLAVALAIGGVGAEETVGKLTPTMRQLFGATSAGATSLNVEAAAPLAPAGSGFTYQGRLKDGTAPANGQYDFQFTLYDAPSAGTVVGGPVSRANQTVSEGLFTMLLDFGANAFNGDARYLEIAVRPTGGGGYTALAPRQPITPAPYALYALKTKGYKNVVVVSPEGGDFTTVTAALNSITNNSASNKYLIWVGPGTYAERVTMKQYVDIEGSGEKTTRITFSGSLSSTGTVVGASNAELRSLTVENTGGNTYAIAIYNSGAWPSLLNLTAMASGGSENYSVYNDNSSPSMTDMTIMVSGVSNVMGVYNYNFSSPSMSNVTITASGSGYNYGVFNDNSSPSMSNVTITASGGFTNMGVRNANASSPSMSNVTVTASGGSENYGVANHGSGMPTINNSVITGSTYTILYAARVGASKLNGGPATETVTCAGVYDENYVFYPNTCP